MLLSHRLETTQQEYININEIIKKIIKKITNFISFLICYSTLYLHFLKEKYAKKKEITKKIRIYIVKGHRKDNHAQIKIL